MKIINIISLLLLFNCAVFSQQGVAINETKQDADASAILDVSSTTKGVLIPRMTSVQKDAIVTPAEGLLIYQIDNNKGYYYFNGTIWVSMLMSQPNVLTTIERTALVPSNGTLVLDSDEKKYYFYDQASSSWKSLASSSTSPNNSKQTIQYSFDSKDSKFTDILFYKSKTATYETYNPYYNLTPQLQVDPYLVTKNLDVISLDVLIRGYTNGVPTSAAQTDVPIKICKYNVSTGARTIIGTVIAKINGSYNGVMAASPSQSIHVDVSNISLSQGDVIGVYVAGTIAPNTVYGLSDCQIILTAQEQ